MERAIMYILARRTREPEVDCLQSNKNRIFAVGFRAITSFVSFESHINIGTQGISQRREFKRLFA